MLASGDDSDCTMGSAGQSDEICALLWQQDENPRSGSRYLALIALKAAD